MDKLAAVMNKVDSVKLVLQENVQVALANCVTLDNIEKAAGAYVRGCVCGMPRTHTWMPVLCVVWCGLNSRPRTRTDQSPCPD